MSDEGTSLGVKKNNSHSLRDKFSGLLAPPQNRLLPWVEAFVITGIICALGWWLRPNDPLLLDAPFPWIWFAPLLISLRYGLMPGIFSSFLIVLDWGVASYINLSSMADFPLVNFLGGLLVTMISGEFSSIWKTRFKQSDEAQIYLVERLNSLTRDYYLQKISHDHLEQEFLSKPHSLRDTLARLREIKAQNSEQTSLLPGIDYMLQLLVEYCRVEVAAVYLPGQDKHGVWIPGNSITNIGNPPPLAQNDPMLLHAMEHGGVTHIDNVLGESLSHLVMAPITGGRGNVLGLIVVSQMPFSALNHETLQFMALLLSFYGDILEVSPEVEVIRKEIPGCPPSIAEEFVRLSNIAKRADVDSHLLVFAFASENADELINIMQQSQRGINMSWKSGADELPLLAVVLPLASDCAVNGYLQRMDKLLVDRVGGGFNEKGVKVSRFVIGKKIPVESIAKLLFIKKTRQVA